MTPGFVTDTMGFLCLLPFSRKFIAENIIKRSSAKFAAGMSGGGFAGGFSQNTGAGFNPNPETHDNVVEGEFTEIEDEPIVIDSNKNK